MNTEPYYQNGLSLKWSKSDRQISNDSTYMWSLRKIIQMNVPNERKTEVDPQT